MFHPKYDVLRLACHYYRPRCFTVSEFQISNLRACMYVGVCGGWVGSNDPYENIFICFIRNDKMPAQAELLDVGESGARTVTSVHFKRPPSNAATGLLDKSRYILLVNST